MGNAIFLPASGSARSHTIDTIYPSSLYKKPAVMGTSLTAQLQS